MYVHTVEENNYLICMFLCVCVCVCAIFPASLNCIKQNVFSILKINVIELYCLQHRFSIHSMTATQCIQVSRCGEDDLLKFKPSVRTGKKGDLSDFERGMVVGADGLV